MNKKIYIASSLKNYKRVIYLRDKLAEYGIWLTYDWADKLNSTEESLREIAEIEYKAVLDCHLLFFVCPSGRGGHFELGLAYAKNKPIVLLRDDNEPIAFYLLPGIELVYSEKEAIELILELLT